jgi:hypothetical protein
MAPDWTNQRVDTASLLIRAPPAKIYGAFEPGQDGTLVVRCENIPPGIRPEDHQAGFGSTLNDLAAFAEASDRAGE